MEKLQNGGQNCPRILESTVECAGLRVYVAVMDVAKSAGSL